MFRIDDCVRVAGRRGRPQRYYVVDVLGDSIVVRDKKGSHITVSAASVHPYPEKVAVTVSDGSASEPYTELKNDEVY